jgi:cellulose 1,4-beta-cellobiosidase
MNTATSTVPRALSLTVTGASGSLSHIASTTLLVNLGPPATLSAMPGDRQVALSWPASVGASSYHLKRSTVSGGPYSVLACPASTTYTDPGLNNGTTYYYSVSAAYSGGPDAGGESVNSKESGATPQGVLPPPVPPSPTSLTTKATKPGSLDLQWVQSSGTGITQNGIYRRISSGSYPPAPTITINAGTSYRDSGLVSKTTYCYVVTAKNSAGESARSAESCAAPK